MKPKYKKWKMPAWMRPYANDIVNTGGNDIEELMNDHDTIVQVNAPRAMICACVKSQVALLELLHSRDQLLKWPLMKVRS